MSEPTNGKAPEPEKSDLPLAAALWSFEERLILGESPDPTDLLSSYPQQKGELEGVLSLLYMGKALLSGENGEVTGGAGPCRPGAVLDDYRIEGEIGRGGMGIVYEAEQISLKRRVALKVLPRVLGLDSLGLKRFQREACIAAALHHTNIVPVYGFGLDQGVAYYSMELIRGPSLDRVIRNLSRAGLPPDTQAHLALIGGETEGKPAALAFARRAAWLLSGVAEGLDAAHRRGIVHRDIKPANLMLSSTGHLVIADFGVARMREIGKATTGAASLGTPHYMSPEQAARRRDPIDHRTDIYSLGVTLYELLTLELPFSGESTDEVLRRIAGSEPPSPGRHNPHLPEDLQAIVLRAMEKSPARRYQTALELSNDLRRFVLGEPVTARKPRWGSRLLRAVGKRWKPLAICLSFLALAAFGGWAYRESRANELRFRSARKAHLVAAAQELLSGEPRGLAVADEADPPADVSLALRAVTLLTEALTLDPRDGRAHFLRGNAFLEAGRLNESVADFSRALDLGALPGPARFRRGTALGWLGRAQESALDIAAALEAALDDPQVLYYRGASAHADGRTQEAMALFRAALERDPSLRVDVFHRLALCEFGREEHDQAIACLRVVLGLRPRWIPAWSLLLQIGLRRSDAAIIAEALGALRNWNPPSEEAQLLLGIGLQFAGDLKGMRQELAGLDARDSWIGSQPDLVAAKLKNDDRAEEAIIEKRLREHPDDFRALLTLGYLRHRQRRFEEAVEVYLRADARSGRKWTALLLAGDSLLHLRRNREASDVLERAVQKRRRILASGSILAAGLDYPVEEIGYRLERDSRMLLHPPEEQNPRLRLGEAYRVQSRWEESRAVLEAAVGEHPRSARAHHELGLTLAALDRTEGAVLELEEAKRLGREDPQTDAVLSHLYATTGRIEKSRACLRESERSHPRNGQVLLAVARLDLLGGRPDEAAAHCRAAVASGDIAGFPQVSLGRALKAAGRTDEARDAFRSAADAFPRWNQPRYELGRLELEARRFETAERELRSAVEAEESPPAGAEDVFCHPRVLASEQIRYELGVALLGQGKVSAAEEELSIRLGAPASSTAVAGEVIKRLLELKGWEEASRYADAFVERNPGNPHALLERARLRAQRNAEAAAADLERAIELEPAAPEPYLLIAQALERAGKSAAAEEALRRGLRAAPRSNALQKGLAGFLMRARRTREAMSILRELLADSPHDQFARNDLAWALLTAKDPADRDPAAALALARPLLDKAPLDPNMINTCGLAFLRAGRLEEARAAFQRADWLCRARGVATPERGDNLFLLSASLSALGQTAEAEKASAEATAIAPASEFRGEAEKALRR